jgi:N,N-dimethylformamidase
MTISLFSIGYASKWTVRSGDELDIMVSTVDKDRNFNASLVKVINGDDLTRYHSMFSAPEIDASFSGEYQGKVQPLNLGSYIHVKETGKLDRLESFSAAAWVYPTFDPTEYTPPDLDNIDPFSPPTLNIAEKINNQTIVSRYDETTKTGWALQLNKDYQLEFLASDGSGGISRFHTEEKINDWAWTYVAFSYDKNAGKLNVYAMEKPYAPGDQFTARTLKQTGQLDVVVQKGPLRIAATRAGAGAARSDLEKPGAVFSGRIQDVRIAKRAMSEQELDQLSAEQAPKKLAKALVADFDFAQGIKSRAITDISSSKLKGELVNVGERAVRGRFWDSSSIQWTDNPDNYDAISFYPDDLYDAQWSPSFSYQIPKNLDSGIYAVKLTSQGFSDYIPFFVVAPKGKPQAKLAVWVSDYNYLAYSNMSIGVTAAKNYPGQNLSNRDSRFLLANLEYATGGVYNQHIDGNYYIYGSRLRPELGTKVSGQIVYNFVADTHITALLEHDGIEYDIITDELLDREGIEVLNQYQAIISSTHHEYVTGASIEQIGEYTANGGRFLYAGANGFFWAVAENPAFPGVLESRNFSAIGDRYLTNGTKGGLMVETGRLYGSIVGTETSAMIFNGSSGYRKEDAAKNPRAAWIFEGTKEGDVFGDGYGIDKVYGGVVGFEVDRYNAGNGVPRHALVLATNEPLKPKIEDVQLGTLPLSIVYHPAEGEPWGQANIVFFETPQGGAVFATGSIAWMGSVVANNFDNDVSTITRNVIKRFLDPAPFPAIQQNEVGTFDRVPSNPEYEWADQN